MGVLRDREPERLEHQHLPDGVGEVLLGADDGRDAHEGVVDGHAEVVDRHARAAHEDEVAQRRLHVPPHHPPDKIINGDNLPLGNLEPVCVRLPGVHPLLDLLGVGIPPRAVVRDGVPGLLRSLPLRLELLLCAKAGIGVTQLHQLLGQLPVDVAPLRLAVGGSGAIDVGALFPVQTEPLEVVNHRLLALLGGTRHIRILDTNHELATVLCSSKVVVQRRAGTSDVQGAGRRGCKAEARFSLVHKGNASVLQPILCDSRFGGRSHGRHSNPPGVVPHGAGEERRQPRSERERLHKGQRGGSSFERSVGCRCDRAQHRSAHHHAQNHQGQR
mmetsp:Transcript_17547/g.40504  ORF Transcript_17547/g.40504 Transcript_17547/m.40504 type:complete len:330 (+) Transcript_17547:1681-2670(+)